MHRVRLDRTVYRCLAVATPGLTHNDAVPTITRAERPGDRVADDVIADISLQNVTEQPFETSLYCLQFEIGQVLYNKLRDRPLCRVYTRLHVARIQDVSICIGLPCRRLQLHVSCIGDKIVVNTALWRAFPP